MLFVSCFISGAQAQQNSMQFTSAANAKVAKASALKSKWEGPTSGPQLQKDKKIIFIAHDMSDAGTYGVFNGMREAASGTGWQILPLDCRGQCNQGAGVVKQALDMKPQGIVLAGVDAASQSKGLTAANEAKVPVAYNRVITPINQPARTTDFAFRQALFTGAGMLEKEVVKGVLGNFEP